MSTIFLVQVLLSGILSGWILFQTAFVAPTVFTKLPEEGRAVFLRAIFPKLFTATAGAGGVFLLLTFLDSPESYVAYGVGAWTVLSGVLCNAIVPATNRARDAGDSQTFARLHKVSVLVTMATLLSHLGWLFFVV